MSWLEVFAFAVDWKCTVCCDFKSFSWHVIIFQLLAVQVSRFR